MKIFNFCDSDVILKERNKNSSVLNYSFDDKFLEFEISNNGIINNSSIKTNMNKAQVYFNLNSIKDLYISLMKSKMNFA